jgi:hypothetical protein
MSSTGVYSRSRPNPLFNREMDLQAKKFSDMLAWVIAHLEHPHELCQELRALGARHSGYRVTIDQYAPVGSALIWMFQHTLGDRFTPEMEEAWLEFYAFASFEMERGSREAATHWYLSVASNSEGLPLQARKVVPPKFPTNILVLVDTFVQ